MGKSTLVLGTFVNWNKDLSEVFIKSLFNTDICLVTEELGYDVSKEYGVEHIKQYIKVLEDPRTFKYDRVILSDVRDVIFQVPVNEIPYEDELCFFLEEDGSAIKNCDYNRHWVEGYFGKVMLESIGDNIISNVSISIGPRDLVLDYLKALYELMLSSGYHKNGIDMAAHNVLIYDKKYPAKLYKNSEGPVWTIGNTKNVIVRNHKFYRQDGSMPAIVHQYDRHVVML